MSDNIKSNVGSREMQGEQPAPEAALELSDTNYIHIWVVPDESLEPPFRIVLTDAGGNSATDVKARPSQTITWSCEQGDFIIRFIDMKHSDGSHTHTSPSARFVHAAERGDDLSIKMRHGIPRGAESKYEVHVITDDNGVISVDPRLIWPQ